MADISAPGSGCVHGVVDLVTGLRRLESGDSTEYYDELSITRFDGVTDVK